MSITDWPIQERPREKLLERGSGALSDAELIAILLRSGIRGKTAVDIARELLVAHGGLRPLFNASSAAVCATPGLGLQTFAHLQAVKELGKRYVQENLIKEENISHIAATKQYLHTKLHDYGREVFACLFLDNRHRLIKFIELFQGTINQAIVHPREVVKQSLHYNAAAVIIAHNHPSGDVVPSTADLALTQQLKEALELVEIKLLDHIIVGGQKTFSCAETGYL
jgi:DNA repair protein RadC